MTALTSFLLAALVVQAAPMPAPLAERSAAVELIERGERREAVERLRVAVAAYPDDPTLVLLLARTYVLDDNGFWAERVLREGLGRMPDDAALRSWLASVCVRQGDVELAAEALSADAIVPEGPERSRRRLLEALIALLQGDAAAGRRALAQVPRHGELYPEDGPVRGLLSRRLDPLWREPLEGTLELTAGHTSNALAGAPTDPSAAGAASPLADLRLRAGLIPPLDTLWRPVLELELTGHRLEDPAYRELSSLEGAVRTGGSAAWGERRLLLLYRAELLYLDQDEARFSAAHRGEVELESRSGLVVFGGAGHRDYRNSRRTRWEADGGVGGPLPLFDKVPLTVGGTLRFADASSPAYDQRGASVAASTRIGLGHRFACRVAAAVSLDDYPHSGRQDGLVDFGSSERRRDLLGRLVVGIEVPSWRGLRPGLEWQLARRDSTIDEWPGSSFDYREWRVVARLRLSLVGDPWAPPAVAEEGHVPLPWGLGSADASEAERITDLLRQDEELRRGSSCGPF